jgi:hypothetical protein
VLRGCCWFHRPLAEPVALGAGDAVFLLRDLPPALSPEPTLSFAEGEPVRFGELGRGAARRQRRGGTAAIRTTVALIDAEDALPGAASSLLIERLAGVLSLYVLSHLAARTGRSLGLLDAARPPELTAVISAMVADRAT